MQVYGPQGAYGPDNRERFKREKKSGGLKSKQTKCLLSFSTISKFANSHMYIYIYASQCHTTNSLLSFYIAHVLCRMIIMN